jgi:hypothetical protein
MCCLLQRLEAKNYDHEEWEMEEEANEQRGKEKSTLLHLTPEMHVRGTSHQTKSSH